MMNTFVFCLFGSFFEHLFAIILRCFAERMNICRLLSKPKSSIRILTATAIFAWTYSKNSGALRSPYPRWQSSITCKKLHESLAHTGENPNTHWMIWILIYISLNFAGVALHMFIANGSKSWWSSCSRDCSYVQDRQNQIRVNSTKLDTKICHGLTLMAILIFENFPSSKDSCYVAQL